MKIRASLLFAICFAGLVSLLNAASIDGKWKLERESGDYPVHLSLTRSGDHNGFSIDPKELVGYSIHQSGPAHFQIDREAGTLTFEGDLDDGEGSGNFRFQSKDAFVSRMASLGYPSLQSEDLYEMTILDVNTSFVESLNRVGYTKLPVDNLIEMKIHGASADFIQKIQAEGYSHLSPDKLVEMRIHG